MKHANNVTFEAQNGPVQSEQIK